MYSMEQYSRRDRGSYFRDTDVLYNVKGKVHAGVITDLRDDDIQILNSVSADYHIVGVEDILWDGILPTVLLPFGGRCLLAGPVGLRCYKKGMTMDNFRAMSVTMKGNKRSHTIELEPMNIGDLLYYKYLNEVVAQRESNRVSQPRNLCTEFYHNLHRGVRQGQPMRIENNMLFYTQGGISITQGLYFTNNKVYYDSIIVDDTNSVWSLYKRMKGMADEDK